MPAAGTGAKPPFVAALIAQWTVFTLLMRGDTKGAFALAHRTPMFWLANFLLGGFAYGFAFTFLLSRLFAVGLNALMGLASALLSPIFDLVGQGGISSDPQYLGLDFGAGLLMFIIIAAAAISIFFARAGLHKATTSWRRIPASFGDVATAQAVGYTGHIVVLLAAVVIAILPADFLLVLAVVLLMTLLPTITFGAELATYIGLNRLGPANKSMLVPYVLFWWVWGLAAGLISYIFLSMYTGMVG